jgi:hypothetical protein
MFQEWPRKMLSCRATECTLGLAVALDTPFATIFVCNEQRWRTIKTAKLKYNYKKILAKT